MINNWPEVESYIKSTAKKAEQDRLDGSREKTGVQLKGITATNPATNQEIPVFIADYVLASYGTGAIMAVPAHDERDFEFAEKFNIDVKRVIESPSPLPYSGEGTLLESEEFTGLHSEEAKVAITNKVDGSLSKTYRLRDWSIGRQRYWGVPIPIVYDPEGNAHSIPEEHLPWTLPDDVDFRPTGEPPLSKSNELKERTERIFGEGWTPEVETMDTFVDSSWYFLRYLDNKNQEEFCSPKRQSDWMPIDIYFGGAEHTTMHLLYSRFFIKALHSLGLTPFTEPYTRRINRSQILGPDGHKMSKSKGNVIDPDEQVERVGADTVKMYLAFMGPYSEVNQYPWDMGGIAGIRRFLERVNGLQEHVVNDETEGTTRLLHKTIRKVCNDITEFKFNTAISALMVFVNHAERAGLSRDSYLTYLKLLAPFAPHLAEELWSVDHNQSIHIEPYPTYDESLAKDELVTIGVQINGKLRGDITITPDASEEDAVAHAKAVDKIEEKLAGQTIKKVVYVPGRILNFILENK
jgi:leucyl-tRNA synthetase